MLLGGVNEYRRRRSEAADTGSGGSEDTGISALKALVMSLGVSGGLTAMAAGEHVFATGVSRMLARVLSGSERLYRPAGHAAALSVIGMAIYELIRRADRRAEHMDDAVEPAFAAAPGSSMVSGGPGSLVSWDTLSREGRRNVSTALGTQLIERVMGEPAAAEPIRVYVGTGKRAHRVRAPGSGPGRASAHGRVRPGAADRHFPDRKRLRQLRRGGGRRVHDPRQHRVGDHAVLAAPVGTVAGPGGRGTSAVPDADRRYPQPARRSDRPGSGRGS